MLAYCEWQDNPDPINTEADMCGKTSTKIEIHPDTCNTGVWAYILLCAFGEDWFVCVCVWRAGRRAAVSTQGDVGQSTGSMGDEAWGCWLWGRVGCWSNRERPRGGTLAVTEKMRIWQWGDREFKQNEACRLAALPSVTGVISGGSLSLCLLPLFI